MSVIIEDSGLLTILQSLEKKPSTDNFQYGGACDKLAFQLANKLVGNKEDALTLEMTVQPAVLKFTEPTVVAFSGADFVGKSNEREIHTNRIYLFDRGDTVEFTERRRGNRLYMAVAGGIEALKTNVLKSGDELIMKREFSVQQHELYHLLKVKGEVSWGVDYYALTEVYISDVFHVVKRPDISDDVYEALEQDVYTVSKEKNRSAVYLDGIEVPDDVKELEMCGVRGGVFLANNQPIVALNDFNSMTTATHVGTIPSYHLHKLSQKRPGSKVKFKVIEASVAHANLYQHFLWMKSLFNAIDYKLSKELVKEKL